jgi:hypothetical protein
MLAWEYDTQILRRAFESVRTVPKSNGRFHDLSSRKRRTRPPRIVFLLGAWTLRSSVMM